MASESEEPYTTDLVLAENGVPAYSARGLSQSLEPIGASQQMRRTINGNLLDVSGSQFRKYKSTITCADMRVPALDGIWPGQTLTVDCVAELCYLTGGSPGRTVVPGSSYIEGNFTFYRPRLDMRVVSFNPIHDEYGAVTSWTLDLEEI
jgi:hypothetical protein